MDLSTPGAILGQLNLTGTVLALAITAVEYAVLLWLAGFPVRSGSTERPAGRLVFGTLIAFLSGAILFPLAISLVQVPLQTGLGRWMVAHVATANQVVLGLPAILASGLVQEPAKFLAASAGVIPAALDSGGESGRAAAAAGDAVAGDSRARAVARAVFLGAVAGAGFGFFEAAHSLSVVFAGATVSGAAGGHLQAVTGLAVVERVSAVLYHLSATGVVIYAWARGAGKGLAVLGVMSLAHGFLNLGAFVCAGSGIGAVFTEAILAVSSLAVFGLLFYLVRPSAPASARGTRATATEGGLGQ